MELRDPKQSVLKSSHPFLNSGGEPMMMRLKDGKWVSNFRFKGRKIEVSLDAYEKEPWKALKNLGALRERLERGEDPITSRKKFKTMKYPEKDPRGISIWETNVKPFFGEYYVKDITRELIESYIVHRWGQKDGKPFGVKSTLDKELRVLKTVICRGMPKWELPRYSYVQKKSSIQKAPLTPELIALAATHMKEQSLIGFWIMAYTGMEPKDIEQLEKGHFKDGLIKKVRSKSSRYKSQPMIQVPVCKGLQEKLKKVPFPLKADQKILPGFDARLFAKQVKRAFEKIGYKEYSAKDLRRYVASRLLDAGYSLDWIAKALGHSPGSRITEVYPGVYEDTLKQAFNEAF